MIVFMYIVTYMMYLMIIIYVYIFFFFLLKSVGTHKLLYNQTQFTHTFTSMDLHFKRKLKSTPTNTAIKLMR